MMACQDHDTERSSLRPGEWYRGPHLNITSRNPNAPKVLKTGLMSRTIVLAYLGLHSNLASQSVFIET